MSLTTAQRDRLAEALGAAFHGGDFGPFTNDRTLSDEFLAPVVADLLAAETARADKAERERDAAREHIAYHLADYRLNSEPTGDLAVDMAGWAGRLRDRAEAAEANVDRLQAGLDEHRAHYVSHEAYADAQAALGRCRELAEALEELTVPCTGPGCAGCTAARLRAAIGGEA